MLRIQLLNLDKTINESKTNGIEINESIKWIKIKRKWNKLTEETQNYINKLAKDNNIVYKDNVVDRELTKESNLQEYNKALNEYLIEDVDLDITEKLNPESIVKISDKNDYDSSVLDFLLCYCAKEI